MAELRGWIVASDTEEYGRVYLFDYAGRFEHDVKSKVMKGAKREGFRGALRKRLSDLGWEIVCIRFKEADHD